MTAYNYEHDYQKHLSKGDILIEPAEKTKVSLYLQRARGDLFLARLLMNISTNTKSKQTLAIDPNYTSFHWIIISAYYAMYHAATAAIANKGIKTRTHVATIAALAKQYTLGSNLAKKLEEISITRFNATRITRKTAQYEVTETYGEKEAQRTIDTAQEFINNINELLR